MTTKQKMSSTENEKHNRYHTYKHFDFDCVFTNTDMYIECSYV